MNLETKSADALARELAERAMRSINSGYCDSVKPIRPDEVSEIILSKTKLRELCAVAEALRKLFEPRGNTISNHEAVKQALAALDGGGK